MVQLGSLHNIHQSFYGMGYTFAWILLECDIQCKWINEKICKKWPKWPKKEEMKNFASNFSLMSFSHFCQ